MKCSARGLFFFLFLLVFFSVPNAASSAGSGQSGFPPFPPDPDLHEEGFFAEPPVQPEEQPPEQLPDQPPELPPKDQDRIFYYRGNRAYYEELPLEIYTINCFRLDEDYVLLEIVFNKSINPRSLNRDSFLVDSNNLPDNIRFSFNRKGDRIKITIPLSDDSFELMVQDIRSFDDTLIEPVEFIVEIDGEEDEYEREGEQDK